MRKRSKQAKSAKLTLSMDPALIDDAKRLARKEGTSVSGMFGRWVRAMTRKRPGAEELAPSVRELTGIISLPPGKTERDVLAEALEERYGLRR